MFHEPHPTTIVSGFDKPDEQGRDAHHLRGRAAL